MTIDRIQGTDGIRGPICLAIDSSKSDPVSFFLDEGMLTEEFFELYTYAYCKELLEVGFAYVLDLVVIGWDPRDLSGHFNDAAVRGIRKAGLTAVVVDVLPTPAISLYQLHIGAACCFVLTASHNPVDQNGIKIFLGYSNLKLFPEDDKRLTHRFFDTNFEEVKRAPLIGKLIYRHEKARNFFLEFMSDTYNHWMTKNTLTGIKIIVDSANGAFSSLIKEFLEKYSNDFVLTNSDPKKGINFLSGVADLEGVEYICANDIENGAFNGYETLYQVLKRGREHNNKLRNGSDLILGFVFDGDGDRCFLLIYDPFEDCIIVLGGDSLAFFQSKFIHNKFNWKKSPLFVNTIESDLEAGQTLQRNGFKTTQCAVGDKWILWEACFYDWQIKQDYYQKKINNTEFNYLLNKVKTNLNQMVQSSKFDALYATKTFLTLENWVRENIGNEMIFRASDYACKQSNNCFAIGGEESGHLVTLARMPFESAKRPVFIGNSLKCALNSVSAIKKLHSRKYTSEFFDYLKNPFPIGFKKNLPVYYVDKSILYEGSLIRDELIELLLDKKYWPGMELKIEQRLEEPEMIILRVLEGGLSVASVFIRNSGTEDKLVLYLRGKDNLANLLEAFAEKIYFFLLVHFKNIKNPMAQAEQMVLKSLKFEPRQTKDFIFGDLNKVSFDRLLHEMSSRQKLIRREGKIWFITKIGLELINFSERSE